MKKVLPFLVLVLLIFVLLGCTSSGPSSDNNLNNSQNASSSVGANQWSDKVAALGEPTYSTVTIANGYQILPFPGLTYAGLRDGYQSFYATNKDYTFAIYAVPSVVNAGKSYADVKTDAVTKYSIYADLKCNDISSGGWLTSAQVFECTYYIAQINANYKSTFFYKNNSYIETILAVRGTTLGTYEYVFDEFNQKAVQWN